MREVISVVHKGVHSEQYVSECLSNSDFECQHLMHCGSSLQKWVAIPESGWAIRFTIDVHWADPIPMLIRRENFCVREKRTVRHEGGKYVVESVFHTDYENLNGRAHRVIQDTEVGCYEEITVDVEWSGQVLTSEIEEDFLKALRRRLVFEDEGNDDVSVSRDESSSQLEEYHSVHAQLESLAHLSEQFLKAVDDAKLDRCQLSLPSGDQISQVSEYVSADRFSISDDVRDMRAEVDRTQRLVSEIKRARQQTGNSSVLPIFILASCAAAIFLVLSRSRRSR